MAGIVVLDAGVIIALHNSRDVHHDWAVEFFHATLEVEWVIHALTLAEVFVHPTRARKAEEFERSITGLSLSVVSMKPGQARELADLRASSGLKMPDVVVLHAAVSAGGALATTDVLLAHEARSRGVEVHSSALASLY